MIGFVLFFPWVLPVLGYIGWIWLDLRYKREQGLKRTEFRHVHHFSFCCGVLFLLLLAIIFPNAVSWTNSGILLLLCGIICILVGLWDLRSVVLHQYDPGRQQLQSRPLGRTAWLMSFITCTFGIFMASFGIPWCIEIVFHSMLSPGISLGAFVLGDTVFFLLMLTLLNNTWREEALVRAAQQLQNMSDAAAREIVSAILEAAESKHGRTRLFFWQLNNLLIGLWPPCLLILLIILDWSRHTPKLFIALFFVSIGLLAVFQAFSRAPGAWAMLPVAAGARKEKFIEYLSIGLLDGFLFCSLGFILFVCTVVPDPLSLQLLAFLACGVIVAGIGFAVYRTRKYRSPQMPKLAAQPRQPVTVNPGRMYLGEIVSMFRRVLSFWIFVFFLEHTFAIDAQLPALLYEIVFVAAGFFIVFPAFRRFIPNL